MISQRQLAANRRNAQLSTGPQTPEGRAAVRSNALRHGLTAKIAVLDNENPEHFQEMLDAFQAEHPGNGWLVAGRGWRRGSRRADVVDISEGRIRSVR
jgi:hypothetical protein